MTQTTPADFAGLEVYDQTALPAGFPVGEASDAELQDAVFGAVPSGADGSKRGSVTSLEGIVVTPSDTDTGLQVDYSFLPQQGIDMGEPMTNVVGAISVDDDPLGVSDAGIDIGPRIGVGDYALSLGGVGWGLVKSTVTGIWNTGAAIFGPSERLQNLDNTEYAGGIDDYEAYPTEPGLSWGMIGDSLSAQIAQSSENARIARANKDYFSLGMAYSENPLMQMSGLGDLAVFGTLNKFGKLTPNRSVSVTSLKGTDDFIEMPSSGKVHFSGDTFHPNTNALVRLDDPRIRYSQAYVSDTTRDGMPIDQLTEIIKRDGYGIGYEPAVLVRMPDDTLVFHDHRRIVAASHAGNEIVPAQIVNWTDDLPAVKAEHLSSVKYKKPVTIPGTNHVIPKKTAPATWGEAVTLRSARQPAKANFPLGGSSQLPWIVYK